MVWQWIGMDGMGWDGRCHVQCMPAGYLAVTSVAMVMVNTHPPADATAAAAGEGLGLDRTGPDSLSVLLIHYCHLIIYQAVYCTSSICISQNFQFQFIYTKILLVAFANLFFLSWKESVQPT